MNIDFEIENELLGNILLNPELMKKIILTEDCFINPQNKFIFNLLKKQYEDSKTINIVALSENYKHLFNNKYPVTDIIQKMTNMLSEALPIKDIYYHQETLFSRYIKLKILESIKSYSKEIISTDELLNDIHKYENMSIKTSDNSLNADEMFKLITSKDKNINFRFDSLSKNSNVQEHDFVVIAARTGIGKTAFILNLLDDLSKDYNCLLFNMEMAEKQVYKRLISIHTKVPMKDLSNFQTDYQKNVVVDGCSDIAKTNFKVINSTQTVTSIKRKIINESKNGHVIAFIDYVGLINSSLKASTPYEKTTMIVKELRQISLDYDCTIFLVSQLNRQSENRSKKDAMPKLSDLKESGELEQSATTVWLLYDENHENNRSKTEIEIQVIIAKNRNGRVGIVPLKYNKENQRYDIPDKKIKDPNLWRKE